MTASAATAVVAIAAALGLAAVLGMLHSRRSGTVRETPATAAPGAAGLHLSTTGPTIVQFTAEWCGSCAAVRRVISQTCAEVPQVAHVEIDMETNPAVAQELSVLSLPTTLIFDAGGRQRYRVSGVPTAADLRAALAPLLA